MKSDLHDIEVYFEYQTKLAILVKKDKDAAGVWLPKSMCEFEPHEPRKGDIITLTASEKLLIEKELADN